MTKQVLACLTSMILTTSIASAQIDMQDKTDPCKVYILEVYADAEAYQAHLKTAHFKKYKNGTSSMVKSLKLIDTNPLITAILNKSAIQ